MQATAKFTTSIKGLKFAVGDNIQFSNSTLGYTDKVFQIQRMNIRASKDKGIVVDFDVKENTPEVYNVDSNTKLDFTSGATITNWTGIPDAPTEILTTSYAQHTSSYIDVSWTGVNMQGTVRYQLTVTNQSDPSDTHSITSYSNSAVVELSASGANDVYDISVVAHSVDHMTSSDPATTTAQGAGLIPTGDTVVTGTFSNPTASQLNELALEANADVIFMHLCYIYN